MKSFKRILSVLLATLILLSPALLSGCRRLFGQSETTTAQTTDYSPVTIYTSTRPGESSSSDEESTAGQTEAETGSSSMVARTTATTAKPTATSAGRISESGKYYSRDEVALYIHTYGHLPSNYITKDKARSLGWNGGSVEPYYPGGAIGGDYYSNYEGTLPAGKTYHECDIDTLGRSSRGAKRIVYSADGAIYYTSDHYEHFTRLY